MYNWYVLSGAGGPVSLQADIVFQARLYAQPDGIGGGAGAFFTQSLNFVSAPDDLTLDRVLVLNGTVIDPAQQPWAFGVQGTVDDVYFANDGTVHELNCIVRSNPFVVTPGVPFRLNLNVGGAADSFGVGTSEAYVDFFDPEFATSAMFPDLSDQLSPNGFVVNLGTNPDGSTRFGQLSDLGYALQSGAIPEPSCALLLAIGLARVRIGRPAPARVGLVLSRANGASLVGADNSIGLEGRRAAVDFACQQRPLALASLALGGVLLYHVAPGAIPEPLRNRPSFELTTRLD